MVSKHFAGPLNSSIDRGAFVTTFSTPQYRDDLIAKATKIV
jgi:hypothetical protein